MEGLTNDSVYFFENAPNYVEADESGNPVLDEDGNEQIVFYDGFLDRNRLGTQIQADNVLGRKTVLYGTPLSNVSRSERHHSL